MEELPGPDRAVPDDYYAEALRNVLDVFPASGTPAAASVVHSFSSPFLRQQVEPSTSALEPSMTPNPTRARLTSLPTRSVVAVWSPEAAGHRVARYCTQG